MDWSVSSRDFHNGNGRFKSKNIRPPNFLDKEIALKRDECIEGDVRTSELKCSILACKRLNTIKSHPGTVFI